MRKQRRRRGEEAALGTGQVAVRRIDSTYREAKHDASIGKDRAHQEKMILWWLDRMKSTLVEVVEHNKWLH